jgi:hypothetical protein
MTARETDSMSDDAFDARLRRLLELDTRDVPGAPSRADAVTRLATAVGRSGDATSVRGRTGGQPSLRTILVLGALAALITGIVAIGAGRTNDDVLVVAPSQLPTTSPIATPQQSPLDSSLCPGGTRAGDIRTLSQPVSTEPRWIADPPPNGARPIAPREIAVVGRGATDESSRGVYLIDVTTGSTCLLVELPPGRTAVRILWAPSGDALAIGLTGLEPGGVDDMLTWTAEGTAASFDGIPALWAPDGSGVLVDVGDGSPSGLQLVPADGSTPLQFVCEPGRADPCPAGPRVHWAPDGSHISLHGGDRWAPRLFSIAALADRQMLPLDTGLEDPDFAGWLDADTVLIASGDGLYRVPIDDPRASTPLGPGTGPSYSFNSDKISPDLAFAALEPVEFGDGLDVVTLATGRSTTAVRPTDVGDDLAIYHFEWAPSSDALAFALTSDLEVVPGLWVVDRDGTGLRQVSTFQIERFERNSTFAWRPAWP